jgi:Cu(I)/Ag(I) efflux system membrane fusion protein
VVYLDHGAGNYEQREVKLGRAGDEAWEVLDGLTEGDRVVTSGNLLIDGQAQLNQGVASATPHEHEGHGTTPAPAPSASAPPTELSPARFEAVHDVLALVNTLAEALAADNLSQFNARTELAKAPVEELRQAFAGAAEWTTLIQPVLQNGSLQPAADLPSARRMFHALSTSVVALAQAARRLPGEWEDLKVFQCPMVKNAFPGAPKTGAWVQLSGPIRNPYFGAEMIDCGNEVKP